MKVKAICALLVVILALGLCGCANRGMVSTSDNGTVTENNVADNYIPGNTRTGYNGTSYRYNTTRYNNGVRKSGTRYNGVGYNNAINNGTSYYGTGYNNVGYNAAKYNANTGYNRLNRSYNAGKLQNYYGNSNPVDGINGNVYSNTASNGNLYTVTGYGTADRINRDKAARYRDRIDQRRYDTGKVTGAEMTPQYTMNAAESDV